MSPMTAAIMSAVPPRRAGAGSAMNDATRELGAALGVAVLGSVAASRYSAGIADAIGHLAPADQAAARTSLGSALQAASHLPSDVAAQLSSAADQAFVSGLHYAALTGAVLAASAAFLVFRFLPHHIAQHGALESAASSAEDVAELALGRRAARVRRHRDHERRVASSTPRAGGVGHRGNEPTLATTAATQIDTDLSPPEWDLARGSISASSCRRMRPRSAAKHSAMLTAPTAASQPTPERDRPTASCRRAPTSAARRGCT